MRLLLISLLIMACLVLPVLAGDPPTGTFEVSGTNPIKVTPVSTGGGSIEFCRWDWGDGSVKSCIGTESATHNYAKPGTYRIMLTQGNHFGSHSATQDIVIAEGYSPPTNTAATVYPTETSIPVKTAIKIQTPKPTPVPTKVPTASPTPIPTVTKEPTVTVQEPVATLPQVTVMPTVVPTPEPSLKSDEVVNEDVPSLSPLAYLWNDFMRFVKEWF